jgi:hypothetical protein
MSVEKRSKKDGEDKSAKNQRMIAGHPDERQNADRPDVKQQGADEYQQTLNKDSKATKRGDSNRVTKR